MHRFFGSISSFIRAFFGSIFSALREMVFISLTGRPKLNGYERWIVDVPIDLHRKVLSSCKEPRSVSERNAFAVVAMQESYERFHAPKLAKAPEEEPPLHFVMTKGGANIEAFAARHGYKDACAVIDESLRVFLHSVDNTVEKHRWRGAFDLPDGRKILLQSGFYAPKGRAYSTPTGNKPKRHLRIAKEKEGES